MRILFDGFWWIDGPVSNRQVMREFILAWEREFPDDELVVAVPSGDLAAVRPQLPDRVGLVGTRIHQQGLSAILELPFVARRLRADLTLTHNFTPLFGRSAVFVHDLMFVTNPEWFTLPERAYFQLMPLGLGRADRIFTSSATEANRIAGATRGRRVTAVGLGMSVALSESVAIAPPGFAESAQFLLSVGRLNARKNLGVAIEAAVASGVLTAERPLLIVGEPEGKSADLSTVARDAVAAGIVLFMGFLSDGELAWLYERARVFLFLSRDEGFGMPTLEAATFGAPIVASDIPVFHEILGSTALYASPDDVPAIAAAIRTAFDGGRKPSVDAVELGYSWALSTQRMRAEIDA
jgi:glycosyltransferase involved in cell wall biosynthesis